MTFSVLQQCQNQFPCPQAVFGSGGCLPSWETMPLFYGTLLQPHSQAFPGFHGSGNPRSAPRTPDTLVSTAFSWQFFVATSTKPMELSGMNSLGSFSGRTPYFSSPEHNEPSVRRFGAALLGLRARRMNDIELRRSEVVKFCVLRELCQRFVTSMERDFLG